MKKLNALFASFSAGAMLFASMLFVACPGNTNPEPEASVTGITLNTDSVVTQFVEGEEFSSEGLIVKAVYSDNTKKTISSTDYAVALASANLSDEGKITLSGAELTDHAETAVVTVSYKEFSATYNVTIAQAAKKITISVDEENLKTAYTVNDELDFSAVKVSAYYTEEEDEEPVDISSAVTFSATYTYGEGESEVSAAFTTAAEGSYSVTFTATYGTLSVSTESAVTITVEEVTEGTAPDLSSYYKNYLVTTDTECTTTLSFGDWGAGSTASKNEDGTWTFTAAEAMWGGNAGVCAPMSGFKSGSFALYEYLVIAADVSNFTSDGGTTGNAGYNVKIPDVQLNVSEYAVTKGNKITFYIPLSAYSSASTATEFAFICGGTGTLTVNEIYLASEDDPSTRAVTAIKMVASGSQVEQGSTVTFTVTDSNYNDVTNDVTFAIDGEDATESSISGNVFTAGTASSAGGTVTVKATYTVDGTDFTDTATVTVIGSLTNEVTSLSFQEAYLAPGWSAILNKVTTLDDASDYVSIDDTNKTVSYKLPSGLVERWQAQLKIGTDADVSSGDIWYFSCKLSGVTGGYTIKLNNDESLITQQTGTITSAEDGATVTLSGTSTVNITDLPIMFDFGTCSEGTAVISNIVFAITGKSADTGSSDQGTDSTITDASTDPVSVDWDTVDYATNGTSNTSLTDKYKFYAVDGEGTLTNIQIPGFDTNEGLYVTFSAAPSALSLDSSAYNLQGAGLLLYCSAFTEKETVFTVTIGSTRYRCAVYYADGTTSDTDEGTDSTEKTDGSGTEAGNAEE